VTERWGAFGEPLDWHKKDSTAVRRGNALRARDGDELAAYHALDQLAKMSQDPETARKARADAEYFRKRHNRRVKARMR